MEDLSIECSSGCVFSYSLKTAAELPAYYDAPPPDYYYYHSIIDKVTILLPLLPTPAADDLHCTILSSQR